MQTYKRYLIFGFTLLMLGVINEAFYRNELVSERDIMQFEEALQNKVAELDKLLATIEIDNTNEHIEIETKLPNGFNLYIFEGNHLCGWTSNSYPIDTFNISHDVSDTVWYMGNSYHYATINKTDSLTYVGTFLLKRSYPYENEFLTNGFISSFRLPDEARISFVAEEGGYPIHIEKDHVAFYITVPNVIKDLSFKKMLSLICYLLSLLTFLYAFYYLLVNLRTNALVTVFILLAFIAFRLLMQTFEFPYIWYSLPLFSPNVYADSLFNPNLGDSLLTAIFMLFAALVMQQKVFKNLDRLFYLKLGVFQLVLLLFLSIFLYTTQSLVVHSSISFEAYKVSGLSAFSFVGVLLLLIQGFSFVILGFRIVQELKRNRSNKKVKLVFAAVNILFLALCNIIWAVPIYTSIIVLLILLFIYIQVDRNNNTYDFTSVSIFTFFLSLVISFNLFYYQKVNEKYKKELIAVNLAYEHDPVAELLLSDVGENIQNDVELSDRIFDISYSFDDIYNYLIKNYFTGFWNKYEVQVSLCSGNDSLQITDWVPCRDFFENFIDSNGVTINDDNTFYFLDNLNGRISYIGQLNFENELGDYSLFIELDSKLSSLQIGYPGLLLKDKDAESNTLAEYSYAKYHKNKLFTQAGDYQYSLENAQAWDTLHRHFSVNGYHHYRFIVDNENEIIVSKQAATFLEQVISFSYIFVFNYLLLIVLFLLFRSTNFQHYLQLSFQHRIQFTIVGLLLLSLIFIGGGAIYFSLNQYTNKHYEILNEKIQSVNIELVHKLSMEDELDEFWYAEKYGNLDQLLIKFSDVFYSDINLYYPDGRLMATSRREVFDIGLKGTYMNNDAFQRMAVEKQAQYIHQEKIGDLSYYSAYIPFTNYENELLAYLNLPYFTKQNVLRNEVTNLAVAILNVFVLLTLLTIGAAFIISRQITQPLQRIQEKMQQVKLNKKNETIAYSRNDEIGQLVTQYNKMLNELENSANLLAQNEREGAWRDMAKQVAHEIKNPLTPMKLTIQHLQRTWKDRREDSDFDIDQLSKTLIDQIDNLANIASAFSNFAKMPEAKLMPINLTDVLQNVVLIYQNENGIEFKAAIPTEPVIVNSDKEQLHSAFSNIIKNAIQAIPKNKKGIIALHCEVVEYSAVVKITDNGKGISNEIKEKLFIPNFTTKSSGTGIGLSIAKKVIEMAGGEIIFHTTLNEGTQFIIKLPLKTE